VSYPRVITRDDYITTLKEVLRNIDQIDTVQGGDYDRREKLVMAAMYEARMAGFECGYRIDPVEPEWPVAYIELPTGQCSWHMPQHSKPYDGHSTEEKYERIREWINGSSE
jgi:hypothetical protein